MADHSPRLCCICGETHCTAGCVPIEQCIWKKQHRQAARQCADNLIAAGILSSSEHDVAVRKFMELDDCDLSATLIETHYLRENKLMNRDYPLAEIGRN